MGLKKPYLFTHKEKTIIFAHLLFHNVSAMWNVMVSLAKQKANLNLWAKCCKLAFSGCILFTIKFIQTCTVIAQLRT